MGRMPAKMAAPVEKVRTGTETEVVGADPEVVVAGPLVDAVGAPAAAVGKDGKPGNGARREQALVAVVVRVALDQARVDREAPARVAAPGGLGMMEATDRADRVVSCLAARGFLHRVLMAVAQPTAVAVVVVAAAAVKVVVAVVAYVSPVAETLAVAAVAVVAPEI